MKRRLHEPAAAERGALRVLRARQAYAGLYDELSYWGPTQGASRSTS
jgi:hypothetical protein